MTSPGFYAGRDYSRQTQKKLLHGVDFVYNWDDV